MKRISMKLSLTAMGMVMAALLFVSRSEAANPVNVDIRVSINATKSLAVGSTIYNYGALGVNVSSVSSSILVTNDSAALVETYTIQGQNAASTQGGTAWTLASSTGALDTYALAAQFSNAQPVNTDVAFTADDLTTSAIVATAGTLGNGTAGESGAAVSPTGGSNTRNLWFRIRTPVSVTDTTQRLATLTLAVQ